MQDEIERPAEDSKGEHLASVQRWRERERPRVTVHVVDGKLRCDLTLPTLNQQAEKA